MFNYADQLRKVVTLIASNVSADDIIATLTHADLQALEQYMRAVEAREEPKLDFYHESVEHLYSMVSNLERNLRRMFSHIHHTQGNGWLLSEYAPVMEQGVFALMRYLGIGDPGSTRTLLTNLVLYIHDKPVLIRDPETYRKAVELLEVTTGLTSFDDTSNQQATLTLFNTCKAYMLEGHTPEANRMIRTIAYETYEELFGIEAQHLGQTHAILKQSYADFVTKPIQELQQQPIELYKGLGSRMEVLLETFFGYYTSTEEAMKNYNLLTGTTMNETLHYIESSLAGGTPELELQRSLTTAQIKDLTKALKKTPGQTGYTESQYRTQSLHILNKVTLASERGATIIGYVDKILHTWNPASEKSEYAQVRSALARLLDGSSKDIYDPLTSFLLYSTIDLAKPIPAMTYENFRTVLWLCDTIKMNKEAIDAFCDHVWVTYGKGDIANHNSLVSTQNTEKLITAEMQRVTEGLGLDKVVRDRLTKQVINFLINGGTVGSPNFVDMQLLHDVIRGLFAFHSGIFNSVHDALTYWNLTLQAERKIHENRAEGKLLETFNCKVERSFIEVVPEEAFTRETRLLLLLLTKDFFVNANLNIAKQYSFDTISLMTPYYKTIMEKMHGEGRSSEHFIERWEDLAAKAYQFAEKDLAKIRKYIIGTYGRFFGNRDAWSSSTHEWVETTLVDFFLLEEEELLRKYKTQDSFDLLSQEIEKIFEVCFFFHDSPAAAMTHFKSVCTKITTGKVEISGDKHVVGKAAPYTNALSQAALTLVLHGSEYDEDTVSLISNSYEAFLSGHIDAVTPEMAKVMKEKEHIFRALLLHYYGSYAGPLDAENAFKELYETILQVNRGSELKLTTGMNKYVPSEPDFNFIFLPDPSEMQAMIDVTLGVVAEMEKNGYESKLPKLANLTNVLTGYFKTRAMGTDTVIRALSLMYADDSLGKEFEHEVNELLVAYMEGKKPSTEEPKLLSKPEVVAVFLWAQTNQA